MNELGTIGSLLRHWAAEQPTRPFLWSGDHRLTFLETDRGSDRVAAGLTALGISKGDRVAIISPNRIEMLELYFAAAKIGAIQVPLNVYLKGEFLRHPLRDSEASALVVDAAGYQTVAPLLGDLPELKCVIMLDPTSSGDGQPTVDLIPYAELRKTEAAPPAVPLTEDDVISIVYTSGTTGLPKGCVLAHGYYLRVAAATERMAQIRNDDVLITALPLFHGAARMMNVAAALRKGITLVIEPQFHRTFLDRAAQTNATLMFGVAAMGRMLLAQPPSDSDTNHKLRAAVWGPADPELEQEVKRRFGIVVNSQAYGQTECALSSYASFEQPAAPGSAGRVSPDLEMRLADDNDEELPVGAVGEIMFRPRHRNAMFQGYWKQPEQTLRTFRGLWYHTGDYGRLSEDGSLFFVDRKKDYIRRRGENVSSIELETAILAHPKITEVAVHEVPSPLTEEDIKACVVVRDGTELVPEELFEFFVGSLPYFAIPRYAEIVPELPKNAVGRVMKHVLRERGVTPTTWDFDGLGLTLTTQGRRGAAS